MIDQTDICNTETYAAEATFTKQIHIKVLRIV